MNDSTDYVKRARLSYHAAQLLAQVQALIECAQPLIDYMGENDPEGIVAALKLQIQAAKYVVDECEGQS